MARIRTVKPEMFKHEVLFDIEHETGLPIRVAWAGLFCVADREGRFKWRPRMLKSEILPYDKIDFSRVLHALATRGLVVCYESGGELFGCIPTFKRHQVINNREKDSELPSVQAEGSQLVDTAGLLTRDEREGDACLTPLVQDQAEGKGREGKGKGRGKEKIPSESAKRTASFIAAYCGRFKERWGSNPEIKDKELGAAKRLAKGWSEDRAAHFLDAYFNMPDAWVVKCKHSLAIMDLKLQEVVVWANSGEFHTMRQAREADSSATNAFLLDKINRGEI